MATAARYFDLIREMKKNAYNHRLRLVESVRIRGIQPTARLFATSPFTVRKWWRRYQQLGPSGLQEHSRAPHRQARKTPQGLAETILALRRRLPPFGAARLRREFDLPLSHMAIQRIWREQGLMQKRRRKYQRKQDLAHIKAQWALFQQISADTKDLDDIPHYWPQAQRFRLPLIQYTARDVRSGLLFWAFAQKRSAAASAVFASRIQQHLHRYGVSLRDLVWQSFTLGSILTAHGEDRAGGMRDHIVRGGASQMRCRTEATGGAANAQHDQIHTALRGFFENSRGRLAIFHGHFRRRTEFHVLWNDFVQLMDGLGDRQLGSLLVFAELPLRDDMQGNETCLVFLGERNGIGCCRPRLGREIRSEEYVVEPRGVMRAAAYTRTDGKYRHRRTAEDFFGDGTEQKFLGAGATVRAEHDKVNVAVFDRLLDCWPDPNSSLYDRFVLQAGKLRLDPLHFHLGPFLYGFDRHSCQPGGGVDVRIRHQDVQRMHAGSVSAPSRYSKQERCFGRLRKIRKIKNVS